MTINLTKEQLLKIVGEIERKALSPDGKRVLAEALNEAEELKAQLDEERLIDPKTLHEPFTI